MTVLRWAAVGTGEISKSVVPDLMACDGVEVVVVQSRAPLKAASFAQEHSIPRSTGSYEEVLADPTVDAIYLATPFAVHFDMAAAAIRAGKHVLIEKPMVMNAKQAEHLFALAREHAVFMMEAMWFKFSPAYERLHQEVADGIIGEARSVRASFGIPFPDNGNSSKWDLARSGGALLDQGIYAVTLAHSFFGEPQSVHAAGTVREDGLDIAEHFTLEFSGGRFAQCASSMSEFSELTASVAGPRGWLTLTPPFWATTDIEVHAGGMREIFREPKLIEFEREGSGYRPMIRAVVAAINEGLLSHPKHAEQDTVAAFRTMDKVLAQVRAN